MNKNDCDYLEVTGNPTQINSAPFIHIYGSMQHVIHWRMTEVTTVRIPSRIKKKAFYLWQL